MGLILNSGMEAQALDRGEAHDGKGQDDQCRAGQGRSNPSTPKIADSQEKRGREGFPPGDVSGCHGSCPVLKPVHFRFEPHKNDPRDHKGQTNDEKGQNNDKRTVRQLKSRMNLVNDGDHQNQNDAKGNDPLIDVGK